MTHPSNQPDSSSPSTPAKPGQKPWLFVLLLGLLACGIVLAQQYRQGDPSQDQVAWQPSYETAIEAAGSSDKPVFVVFSADWCGPCKQMKAWVFSDTAVADRITHDFVPVRIDLTHNESSAIDLAQRYNVQGIPALFVLDAEGNPLSRMTGYMSKDELMNWLDVAAWKLDNPTPPIAAVP